MTMNGLPYYKRFPRDLIEGTVGMPFEEKVTYAFVLDLIYMHGGELPDDARYIAGVLGTSVRRWNVIRAALLERGKIASNEGLLTNYRAIIELESLRSLQDKQRQNRSHPNKNKGIQSPRFDHTEPDTDTEVETSVSTKKRARAPIKTQIPPDAVLGADEWAKAEAKGLSHTEAEAQFIRFRDSAIAAGRGYADWGKAWVNWLGSPYFRPITTVTPFPSRGRTNGPGLDDHLDALKAFVSVQRLE
jgi:uncharacterized protein YdaU (DUF1376 family)